MMVTYLRMHNLDPELASQVRPLHPMRSRFWGLVDRSSFCRSVRDVEEVSALVSEIEAESAGVPVLWRQYLKLNATVLSFNVDPAFNDSLDGLVLVDLRRTEPHVLRKYMGEVGVAQFLAYHEATSQMREPA
jgi:tryptophan synthase alpha subunit